MIYGNKFVWWTGVVEDRNDPEQLGRCRVRIFGFHTDDVTLLPTRDLPWAIPLQPITSAATSGLGHTPVGIVNGSWVVGWFLDGEEAQRPLIIGTIAGKPEKQPEGIKKQKQEANKAEKNIVRSGDGSPVVDQNNKPITTIGNVNREDDLYPLTADDLKTIFATIGSKASGDDMTKESMDGRLGKYQLSVQTLVSLGYVKRPNNDFALTAWTDTNSNWTGKDGISSKAEFLKSESAQYNSMLSASESNYKSLLLSGKITQQDDPKIIGALLGTSLVIGVNNSDKLNKKLESGVLVKDYFVSVNSALGGSSDDFNNDIETALTYLADVNANNQGIVNNKELLKRRGFSDPNKEYPKYEYLGLPDVNKLALGDETHNTFKVKSNKRVTSIPLPNTTQTWDEPRPNYGAGYPYNQVTETEAGHVIELDSTPGAERIHVFHKSGAYIEIDVNGSMVRKVIGDNYEIIDRNNFTYVRGSHCLTVEGKMSMLVKNSAHIVVEGSLAVTSHKDTSIETAGTTTITGKNINVSSTESLNLITEGSLNLQGKNINLYAKGGSISQKAGQDFSMESGTASTFSIKGGQSLLMDAAIIKTKMGANAIKGIAFGALPLPEAKTIDATPIPVLIRDVVPESFFAFDGGEPDAPAHIKTLEESGQMNNDVVPVEIPTERKETIISTTIKEGVVTEVITPPAITNTTEETVVLPTEKVVVVYPTKEVVVVNPTPPITTTTTITTIIEDEIVIVKKVVKDAVANTTVTSTTTTNPNVTTKVKNITKYPTTDAEIRAFQESKGLTADGVIGPKTEAALNAAGLKNPTPAPTVADTKATTDLTGAAKATGTTISAFTTDTVDAGAKIINKAIAAVKNILPSSKW